MPRLSTISNKLTTTGSKKSPVVVKVYTGTDFTASHSTWTFSTGTLSLRTSTLPYHSYGNFREPTTATNQLTNKTWSLRAGPISTASIFSTTLTATTATFTFTTTVIATTLTYVTTITDTTIVFNTTSTAGLTANQLISFSTNSIGVVPGVSFYVRSITSSSFRVSAIRNGNPISVSGTGTVLAAFNGISTASTNIGYWLNGVNIHNPSAGVEVPNGYLSFPNLNYVAEYRTSLKYSYDLFHDLAGGRTINNGSYAYHGYSFEAAWTTGTAHIGNTGTAVTAGTTETSIVSYLGGSLVHSDGHSKIVGWSLDGYPIYGPYGYSLPLDAYSLVRPMTSGYKIYTDPSDVQGRKTDGVLNIVTYPMGMFVQDYYFSGDGDLDLHNGRYCVTPEYPNGTYAYFCSLDPATLTPSYPYVIGTVFRSTPVGPAQTTSTHVSGGGSSPKQTI